MLKRERERDMKEVRVGREEKEKGIK